MTREEAIQFIDNIKHEEAGRAIGSDGFFAELMGYHVEALQMAIKAMQKEPCDDCTSKQAVKEQMIKYGFHAPDMTITEFVEDELPSVQPEPFINKPCVSEQACREDKMKVLEKIKAEIEAKCCITVGRECDGAITLHDVFEILDKYMEEVTDND